MSTAFAPGHSTPKAAIAEGTWKRQADNWVVHNSGVTTDGRSSAATSLYTSINEEGFLPEIVGAMLDSELKPDIKVKMIRQTRQDG